MNINNFTHAYLICLYCYKILCVDQERMGSSNSTGGKKCDRVTSTGVDAALYRRRSEVGERWLRGVGMGCCGHQVIDTQH